MGFNAYDKEPPVRFNSLKQLSRADAEQIASEITGAFYARHPEVLTAVNQDAATKGRLTTKTQKMMRAALDRDAAMESALENISCDPHRRANPQVFHNEWEEFSHQLVGYAREALGMEPLAGNYSDQDDPRTNPHPR